MLAAGPIGRQTRPGRPLLELRFAVTLGHGDPDLPVRRAYREPNSLPRARNGRKEEGAGQCPQCPPGLRPPGPPPRKKKSKEKGRKRAKMALSRRPTGRDQRYRGHLRAAPSPKTRLISQNQLKNRQKRQLPSQVVSKETTNRPQSALERRGACWQGKPLQKHKKGTHWTSQSASRH